MKRLIYLMLVAALTITGSLQAEGAEKWTFSYKEGHIYSYSFNTQVQTYTQSSGINMDPDTYEMVYYPGQGFNRSFNISATVEIEINGVDSKGNAKGKARFTDLYVTAGLRIDEPKRHAMSIEMVRGEHKQKSIESDGIDKHEIRVVLPARGGIDIKGNLSFMGKYVGKLLTMMNTHDNMFSKRHKEMTSTGWWENFFNMHFFALDKGDKVPGSTQRVLPLFLGSNHGVVSKITDEKKGCPVELVSISQKDEYAQVDLTTTFNVNLDTGGGNTQQLVALNNEPLVFSRDPEGHLLTGPYKVQLFYQAEGAGKRVNTQSVVTSICKFEGKRPAE